MTDNEKLKAIRIARLAQLISEKFQTQANFIEATGENQGEVSALVNGKKSFGEKKARSIERKAGVAARSLDSFNIPFDGNISIESENSSGENFPIQSNQSNTETAVTKGKLPLISWVQAGEWSDIVDNFEPGDAEEWIPCPFSHGPGAFILRVVGHSMYNPGGEKSYAPGEFIAIDPNGEIQNRKMVVVRIDHEEKATFKQLLIDSEGTMMLQALNPSHVPRIMTMPEGSRISGIVIGKWVPE